MLLVPGTVVLTLNLSYWGGWWGRIAGVQDKLGQHSKTFSLKKKNLFSVLHFINEQTVTQLVVEGLELFKSPNV